MLKRSSEYKLVLEPDQIIKQIYWEKNLKYNLDPVSLDNQNDGYHKDKNVEKYQK